MAYKKDSYIENLQGNFRFSQKPERLDVAFTQDKVREMLEDKRNKSINMKFPFIVAFIDRAIEYAE